MGIADIAAVSIFIAGAVSPTRQAFGTPNYCAYFDSATKWQNSGDRIRFYASSSALTTLVADGFKTTGPIYRAFQVALAQSPCPPQIALSRRALPPTQVLKMTLSDVVAGDRYAVTAIGSDGVSVTNTLSSTGVPATDAASFAALFTAETPSGSVASLAFAGGVMTLTGGSGFSAGNVGEQIVISNSATPANNGTFAIATYISATSVTFANPAGANDAGATVHFAVGPKIGTVTVSGAVITITQAAGTLTDLVNWTSNIAVSNTTADPGIATDLAAITAANSIGWYGLSLDSNSAAEVAAAATFVEATGQGGKWGFFDAADTTDCSAATTTDVFSTMQALTRLKSGVVQSNRQVLSCSGFGLASLVLAMFPGSYNVSFKSIAGVLADNDQTMTETQQLVINTCSTSQPGTGGKGGNWFKTVSGVNMVFPGVTPGGRWIDQGIFADWLQNNMQADVFAVLAGLPKVPLTDIGIALVVAAIKSRLKIGASPPYGGIDGTRPIVVNAPTAASMSQSDRNNRNLSGITGSFYFSGAINTTTIQITGSP
jgi:Protein of unknown function (DUF3383)